MKTKPENFSTKIMYEQVTTPLGAQALQMMLKEIVKATQGPEAANQELCRDKTKDILEGAVAGAFQTFGDQELYPTAFDKACHIAYTIIHDHPAKDGNKRLGILAFFVCGCYFNNGLGFTMSEEKFVKDVLDCAAGKLTKADFRQIMDEDCEEDYEAYPFTSAIYEVTVKDYWTGVEAMTSAYIEKFRKPLIELA